LLILAFVRHYYHNLFAWLADMIANKASKGLVGFLNSEPDETSGAWADFRAARSWAKDGEVKKAIALTKAELKKEPDNFEGLILLGSLYADSGSPKRALEATETLLRSRPSLTPEQKQAALEKKAIYEKLKSG
jgi:lipopolysaccharide biosynthesis regulator YciM